MKAIRFDILYCDADGEPHRLALDWNAGEQARLRIDDQRMDVYLTAGCSKLQPHSRWQASLKENHRDES